MNQMELFEESVLQESMAVKPELQKAGDDINTLKAANKVEREIHRLTGLLRFSPQTDGVYIARCAPDYFILPALAEHFTLRFGDTPWAIIDERRSLCLCKGKGSDARIIELPPSLSARDEDSKDSTNKRNKDSWEDLWCLYHKSINNDARNNSRLQRQFIPKRYQKYLCELDN